MGGSAEWRSTFVCPSAPLGGSFLRVLCSLMGPERDGQLVQLFPVIRRETQLQGLHVVVEMESPCPSFLFFKIQLSQ